LAGIIHCLELKPSRIIEKYEPHEFRKHIEDIRLGIKAGRFINEAAISPKAWAGLLEEENEELLELVAGRVESLCGFKPDPDTVAHFLKTNVALKTPATMPPQPPKRKSAPTPPAIPNPPTNAPNQKPFTIGFVLEWAVFSGTKSKRFVGSFF